MVDRRTTDGYVECAICGDQLVQMTGSHTAKHGLTFQEYTNQFPNSPTIARALRKTLSHNAREQWEKDRDKLVLIRRKVGKERSGANHHRWKGGYEAGVTGGHPKSKARRRAIRVYGKQCMIPECDFHHVVHNHHIVPRSEKGGHSLDNCILLCPNHHALADAGILTREYLFSILAEYRKVKTNE
jgi:hypothetical protein